MKQKQMIEIEKISHLPFFIGHFSLVISENSLASETVFQPEREN